jgi:hypothetical protein
MTTIRCSIDTPLPEERVRAALTDFSAHRPTVWPNLDPGLYQIHGAGLHGPMSPRDPASAPHPS